MLLRIIDGAITEIIFVQRKVDDRSSSFGCWFGDVHHNDGAHTFEKTQVWFLLPWAQLHFVDYALATHGT